MVRSFKLATRPRAVNVCAPKSMRTSLLVLAIASANIVGQRIGVHHGGAGVLRALAFEPHVARHVDDLAAGLDVRDVAEHDPGLSVRRLVIEAHIVERDLRAMIDLIDAVGLDADGGSAGLVIVGEHGILQIVARQLRLLGLGR